MLARLARADAILRPSSQVTLAPLRLQADAKAGDPAISASAMMISVRMAAP
jgi:hypothetical protein